MSSVCKRLGNLWCNCSKVHWSQVFPFLGCLVLLHLSPRVKSWFSVCSGANIKARWGFFERIPRACEWVSVCECSLFRTCIFHGWFPDGGWFPEVHDEERHDSILCEKLLEQLSRFVELTRVFNTSKKNCSVLEKLVGPLWLFKFENHCRDTSLFCIWYNLLSHRSWKVTKFLCEILQNEWLVYVEYSVDVLVCRFCTKQSF